VTLVLFDIDGTLIQTGRAGVRGMNRAFGDLYDAPDALASVSVAGRTDRAIVTEVLTTLGHEADDGAIVRVRDRYCGYLPAALQDPASRPMGVLPGVHAMLDQLASRSDVVVGLLTGNFIKGAELKLGHFDLWRRFAFGAFGDHHTNRRDLVPRAIAAAVEAGHPEFTTDRVVVIGDTPLDVDCAHFNGARALAVATGIHDVETLRATGADLTVDTLAQVSADWF
jgi:phosphoglycolate phosphatase-like HAD superfamily hydrolase